MEMAAAAAALSLPVRQNPADWGVDGIGSVVGLDTLRGTSANKMSSIPEGTPPVGGGEPPALDEAAAMKLQKLEKAYKAGALSKEMYDKMV